MRFKEFSPAPLYYFAYGMLTSPDNMPGAELIGAAELRNFKFEMMIYANVVYSPGDKVLGTLWNIERSLLGKLDKVEGCPWLYNRKTVPVYCEEKKYESEVYIMTPESREHYYGSLPRKEYIQSLIKGYNNVGIPLTQISNALRAIPAIDIHSRKNINEVNMSPGSLKKFTQLLGNTNIKVGFEAEMIVPNLESYDDTDYIEDYSKDIPFPTNKNMHDIILEWFANSDNPEQEHWIKIKIKRFIYDLTLYIDNKFDDYLSTKDGKQDLYNVLKNDHLKDEPQVTDQIIQNDILTKNDWYDSAVDKLMNKFIHATNYRTEFIKSRHIETMRDFCILYNISWPYFKPAYVGTMTIEELEKDFSNFTGFSATASREYHRVKREPNLWIFEPDSSIKDNTNKGGGIELISPPIQLQQIFKTLDIFWKWAEKKNITANDTCGFHVGVSLPDQSTWQIDKLKLMCFLGEEHILKTFGRQNNEYARSTFDFIKSGFKHNIDLDKAIPIIKSGLDKIANHYFLQTLAIGNNRYNSINVKVKYIEFRLAGGNYFNKKDEITNSIMRYVKAMVIAADPQAEKKEYAKKLYKLLSLNTDLENDIINVFAKYVAGDISIDELKDQVYTIRRKRKGYY